MTSLGPCRCNLGVWGGLLGGPQMDKVHFGVSDTPMCRVRSLDLHSFPFPAFPFFSPVEEGQDYPPAPFLGAAPST